MSRHCCRQDRGIRRTSHFLQQSHVAATIRLLVQSKEGGGSKALKLQACYEQIDLFRLTYSTLVTPKWARNTNGAAGPALSPVARAKATARDTGQKCLRHSTQSAQMNHSDTSVRTQQVCIEGWQCPQEYPHRPTLAYSHRCPLCVTGKYRVGRGGSGGASCTACGTGKERVGTRGSSALTYMVV